MPAKATAPAPPTPEEIAAQKKRARKAVWACDTLDAEYGALLWKSHGKPLPALVMTILSQHTSDKNSERAFDNLQAAFPDWDAVRVAPTETIADTIRSGGLADAKAPRIKGVLEQIYQKTGRVSLDFLDEMTTTEAKNYLNAFHGVGPKTTACVMMFSLCRPVLPVDTHVFRVSHRLGLIEKRIGEARAHDALEALIPPERVYAFHVHMIRHGRRVCIAQRPRCSACALQTKCDYFLSGQSEQTGQAAKEVPAKTDAAETLHGLKQA